MKMKELWYLRLEIRERIINSLRKEFPDKAPSETRYYNKERYSIKLQEQVKQHKEITDQIIKLLLDKLDQCS